MELAGNGQMQTGAIIGAAKQVPENYGKITDRENHLHPPIGSYPSGHSSKEYTQGQLIFTLNQMGLSSTDR